MSQRQSSRKSAVTKRRLLEEKLEKRRSEAGVRALKSRSQALKDLHEEELDVFAKEANELNELLERFHPQELISDNNSDQSLEWDNTEEATSPSFLVENIEGEDSVAEIIQQILSPETETFEDLVHPVDVERESKRKRTSTDNDFLEGTVVVPTQFPWPPRFPSQEPEDTIEFPDLLHLDQHILQPLVEVDTENEVFETANNLSQQPTTMEEAAYNAKLRVVKIAERKVRNQQKKFLPENVTSIHVPEYRDRLKEIRTILGTYEDAVSDIVVDLDETIEGDKARITYLDKEQDALQREVLENEKQVEAKIKTLIESQPLSKAEQESLQIQRKQLEIAKEKEEIVLNEKGQKFEIDMSDISSRIKDILEVVTKVKSSKDLSDPEVKQALLDSKKWESKFEALTTSKLKLDKDMVGLKVDNSAVLKINQDFSSLKETVKQKLNDLKSADEERCLFSLSKAVKEVAVYPSPFSGAAGENVYKFRDKFMEAIISNQVREKDKQEVLRKHLKGVAKEVVGEYQDTFKDAMETLVNRFGSSNKIWETRKMNFEKRCNDPKKWSVIGSDERLGLITRTCEFLREAQQLATDYKALSNDIYSKTTCDSIYKVIPQTISEKIWDQSKGDGEIDWKEVLGRIKTQMDVEHNKAKEANVHYQAIKDNIASYSSASGNLRPDTWKTKFQNKEKWKSKNSHHDCEKSPNCNTKWESLGCSKIYELHTVEERRNYLKEKGKCFCCGREFHGVPRYPKQMCAWDSELEVVRCRQGGCRLGAAVCFEHQGENASQELKSWLDSKKIKTTVTSIRSYPCHGRSFSTPKTTKVSENIRSQLQKGETSTNFSNEQLTEFFTADLQKKGK